MTDPISRADISTGLRRLADLVDAGLLDERRFDRTRQHVSVILVTPSDVARFAATLGVEVQNDVADDDVHIRAEADLDGVSVTGYCIVPADEFAAEVTR